MIDVFVRGGVLFMLPLLAASVAVIAFAIERIIHFRRAWVDYGPLVDELKETINKRGLPAARVEVDEIPGPVARTWSEGLAAARLPFPLIRERMEAAALEEIARLERHLPHIALIGQLAPLVGILGTVWGMIASFQVMEEGLSAGGGINSEILAGGIWQALITTAGGLLVAIPALITHHYLEARVDRFVAQLERSPADLIACLVPLRVKSAEQPRTTKLAEAQ